MKLTDIFSKNQLSLSFEVFPPKLDSAFESVKHATEEIAKLYPSFMSVTYGAGGGTSKYTLEIAKNIRERFGVESLAHLTCVSSTRETVLARIEDFKAAGVQNIMALRGDIPKEMQGIDRSTWAYRHAVDLVHEIKQSGGDFCIGGACYPEVHPESVNQSEDLQHLKEKVDAGCDFLTTQMFFDNHLLYDFTDKIRQVGIQVPVIAGIMPITNAKQVERAVSLSGSFIPAKFMALVEKHADNPADMKKAGLAYATQQIIDLYENGVQCVHVYSMNKPDVAQTIWNNLSHIVGKYV